MIWSSASKFCPEEYSRGFMRTLATTVFIFYLFFLIFFFKKKSIFVVNLFCLLVILGNEVGVGGEKFVYRCGGREYMG